MRKRMTVTVSEEVYDGLYGVIGRGKISQFIENLVRPYVVESAMAEGYRLMAKDEENEAEALEWIEGVSRDIED